MKQLKIITEMIFIELDTQSNRLPVFIKYRIQQVEQKAIQRCGTDCFLGMK